MKKILLPLFVCGILVTVNAQPIDPKKNITKSNKEADAEPVINETDKWIITPLAAMTTGIGKLSIKIPKDTTIYVPTLEKWITIPYLIRDTVKINQSGNSNDYAIINLPKYLAARSHHIKLNNVIVTVPVESGKETRIKAGFLIITKKEDPESNDIFDHLFGQLDAENWEWKLQNLYQGNTWYTIASGKKGAIIAMPPGEYKLIKLDPKDAGPGGDDIKYKVIIKDGEWVKNGIKQ